MMSSKDDKNLSERFGKSMALIASVLVLILLTLFFNKWLEKQHNPNQSVHSSTKNDGIREIQLKRNKAGHYVATGSINGVDVVFLVDTGASNIAVPAHMATKLKLHQGRPILFHTANGNVQGYATEASHVKLGNIELHKVAAGINPGMHGKEILLGMSFLKPLEFTQRGDILTIRQYP